MTHTSEGTIGAHLRYLTASKVESPAGALSQIGVRVDGANVGGLDGVLIDPGARKIRYYVVLLRRWFGAQRYLLPADQPAEVEGAGKSLRFQIDLPALKSCQEFRLGDVPEFSDEDLVSTMFAKLA